MRAIACRVSSRSSPRAVKTGVAKLGQEPRQQEAVGDHHQERDKQASTTRQFPSGRSVLPAIRPRSGRARRATRFPRSMSTSRCAWRARVSRKLRSPAARMPHPGRFRATARKTTIAAKIRAAAGCHPARPRRGEGSVPARIPCSSRQLAQPARLGQQDKVQPSTFSLATTLERYHAWLAVQRQHGKTDRDRDHAARRARPAGRLLD